MDNLFAKRLAIFPLQQRGQLLHRRLPIAVVPDESCSLVETMGLMIREVIDEHLIREFLHDHLLTPC
jgi:hypothetical protein